MVVRMRCLNGRKFGSHYVKVSNCTYKVDKQSSIPLFGSSTRSHVESRRRPKNSSSTTFVSASQMSRLKELTYWIMLNAFDNIFLESFVYLLLPNLLGASSVIGRCSRVRLRSCARRAPVDGGWLNERHINGTPESLHVRHSVVMYEWRRCHGNGANSC